MFDWLRSNRHQELPYYSELNAIASRGLPTSLDEQEGSESYGIRRDAIERELLETARCPPDDQPIFTSLVRGGVVTIPVPESDAMCLPVFSTPLRAADYARTLLASSFRLKYLASSPLQFTRMLRDLEKTTVNAFTVDRCPRCSILTSVGVGTITCAADVGRTWAIFKATELASNGTVPRVCIGRGPRKSPGGSPRRGASRCRPRKPGGSASPPIVRSVGGRARGPDTLAGSQGISAVPESVSLEADP